MNLKRTRRPVCENLLAELQDYASLHQWGSVSPLSTWETMNLDSGRFVTIQRRGGAFFAASADVVAGPASTARAAVAALDAALAPASEVEGAPV